jgi:hypothetical protein
MMPEFKYIISSFKVIIIVYDQIKLSITVNIFLIIKDVELNLSAAFFNLSKVNCYAFKLMGYFRWQNIIELNQKCPRISFIFIKPIHCFLPWRVCKWVNFDDQVLVGDTAQLKLSLTFVLNFLHLKLLIYNL